MTYPAPITSTVSTSIDPTATAWHGQRKVDRTSNGVLWSHYWNGNSGGSDSGGTVAHMRFAYSTDHGANWTDTASNGFVFNGLGNSYHPNSSFFIDVDDYAHVAYKDRNDGYIYYRRGTPNAGRTAWTWSSPALLAANTSRNLPDIVAHREGTGWVAHVVFQYWTSATVVEYVKVTVSSVGAINVASVAGISAGYNSGLINHRPSIDFHHTGDGKTIKDGTPHLYVAWSAGGTGAGKGIRFKKSTYSGGTWTWGTERELDSTRYLDGGDQQWLNCLFDGTRVIVPGNFNDGSGNIDIIVYDRDVDDTTTTTHSVDTTSTGVANIFSWGSATYDRNGNVYFFGSPDVTAPGSSVHYKMWTRATNTLGSAVVLDTDSTYVSVKRGYRGNRIDLVYTKGTANPYSVKSWSRVATDEAPFILEPLLPKNGTIVDPRGTITISWNYSDPEGMPQTAVEIEWILQNGTTGTISQSTSNNYYDVPADTWPLDSIVRFRMRVSDGTIWSGWSLWLAVEASAWTYEEIVSSSATSDFIDAQALGTYSIAVQAGTRTGFSDWSTPVSVQQENAVVKTGSETIAITATESRSISGNQNTRSDSSAISLSESSAILKTIVASDSAAVSVSEFGTRFRSFPGVQPVGISITETRAILKTSSASDSNSIGITETAGTLSFNAKIASEQYSLSVAEAAAKQTFNVASSVEPCYISIQEVTTLLKIDKEVEPVSGATAVELRKKPVGLWPLATNLDYSGYGRDAVFNGTPGTHLPLVAGVSNSTVFDNTNTGRFPAPVFQKGYEDRPFTIEANFRSINVDGTTAEQQVLGNQGQMDGIVVEGSVVKFKMNYTGGTVTASYDLQIPRAVRASAVHTSEKNSLYIDGELAAEVDIPEEYRADEFVASNGFLYSGASATTDKIAVGGVSAYAVALSAEEVSENYYAVNNISEPEDFTGMYGGNRIVLSSDRLDRFLNRAWESQEDWTAGSFLEQAAVLSGDVFPESESGLTVAGAWYNSFELDSANGVSIYGVNMEWDGDGVSIEASLDGATWTPVVRGRNISIIPQGFNPVETILHIRALFTAGLPEGTAVLRSLEVNGYADGDITVHNIDVDLNNASPRKDRLPVEFRDDWGVELNAGSITLTPLASTEEPVRTVEVWSKSAAALTTTLTPTATYTNAESAPFTSDEWQVRHYVVSGGQTAPFTISGTGQIGQIVLYDRALSQTESNEIVDSYFFPPTSVVMESSPIVVNSVDEGAMIYAHDWTIEGAG